ncbi:MAG: hypothetical protein SGILL_005478 [Bacillariaceae sp.]
MDPLTLFGDPRWSDIHLEVEAMVNHTAPHHYLRVCGGCANLSYQRILFGCREELCFKLFGNGTWFIGNASGFFEGFQDTWHSIRLETGDGKVAVVMDQDQVLLTDASTTPGMIGLGCGSYHNCAIRRVSLTAGSGTSSVV